MVMDYVPENSIFEVQTLYIFFPLPLPLAKLDTRHINKRPRKDACEAIFSTGITLPCHPRNYNTGRLIHRNAPPLARHSHSGGIQDTLCFIDARLAVSFASLKWMGHF